jgi:hypothetical protein
LNPPAGGQASRQVWFNPPAGGGGATLGYWGVFENMNIRILILTDKSINRKIFL